MAILEKKTAGAYKVISGNYCAAYGAKLARAEVVSVYPITPQTTVVEKLVEFIASGQMEAKFINVESEHSALAALIGAAVVGARTFTATSRQGLALMHEMVHWAGRGRVPIVMAAVSSGLGAPMHTGAEQDDVLSDRDTGWLQFYCESNQEVLDTVIQAFRIAEEVSLPVMVILDAFYLSHTFEPVFIPEIEIVDHYLPKRETRFKFNPDEPMSFFATPFGGGPDPTKYNARLRRQTQEAMEVAKEIVKKADAEFEQLFGRSYGVVESYQIEDAELIVVTTSTIASITRSVIDAFREQGKRIGLLRIRMFRPFPTKEISMALSNAQKVAVIDRNISYGRGGVFATEVMAAMYNEQRRPPIFGFIAGITGLPVTPKLITEAVDYVYTHETPEAEIIWLGVPQ